MKVSIRVEALKLTHSLVAVIATLVIVLGPLVLLGSITAAIASGNPALITKAGPAATRNWDGLLAGATEVVAVASILGFGIVLAWMFAREFTEGTIIGLFALPVSRSHIALGKLTVFLLWAAIVSLALTLGVLLLGCALGYGAPSLARWAKLARVFILALFSAGLTAPIAWIATLTRSLLAAVGCTVMLVITAEVGALAGAGGWMPFAAPALWAMTNGTGVTFAQLTLSLAVPLAFFFLVRRTWAHLQLDR